jgi:hypothetical protein
MKRITVVGLTLIFIAVGLSSARAWFWEQKKESKKTQAPAATQQNKAAPAGKGTSGASAPAAKKPAVVDKAKADAAQAKKEMLAKKRQELNNTEWGIQLNPVSGKGKKETDTAVFQNSEVVFTNFSKKGFPESSYALSVQEDGTLIWETMQTSEKSGINFWRGEVSPDLQSMRGFMNHQIDDKNREEFSFFSSSKKNLPLSSIGG